MASHSTIHHPISRKIPPKCYLSRAASVLVLCKATVDSIPLNFCESASANGEIVDLIGIHSGRENRNVTDGVIAAGDGLDVEITYPYQSAITVEEASKALVRPGDDPERGTLR